MNKVFKFALCAACAISLAACNGGGGGVTSDKEAALQKTVTPYVNNTVVATYSAMADAGLTLLDQAVEIFIDGGRVAMTNLVFPNEPYDALEFYSDKGQFRVDGLKITPLGL